MVARNRFTLREDVNESELSEQRVMPSLLGGVQIPVTRSRWRPHDVFLFLILHFAFCIYP